MQKILPYLNFFLLIMLSVVVFYGFQKKDNAALVSPMQKYVQATTKSVSPSVVAIMWEKNTVIGTGVAIDTRIVLTSLHVVADKNEYIVRTIDDQKILSHVVARHPTLDLALLELKDGFMQPIPIISSTDRLMLGDFVLGFWASSSTIIPQFGILSAMDQEIDFAGKKLTGLLSTDMRIWWGDSGGPLVNVQGQLIGIATGYKHSSDISWDTPVDAIVINNWIQDLN